MGVSAALTYVSAGAGDLAGSAFESTKTLGAQLAMAGATSAVNTFGGVITSCIQYEPGGGFGFDKDKFTDNATWSQAGLTFATSFASSAISSSLKTGLEINSNLISTSLTTLTSTMAQNIKVGGDGGWDWQGFGNIDWQKAAISGAGNYASSVLTGGMRDQYMQSMMSGLVSTYTQNLAARAFDREDEYGLEKVINVDTLSIATKGIYNDTKDMYKAYQDRQQLIDEGFTDDLLDSGLEEQVTDNRSLWDKFKDRAGTEFSKLGSDFLSMGSSLILEYKNIVSDGQKIGGVIVSGAKGIAKGFEDLFATKEVKNKDGNIKAANDLMKKYGITNLHASYELAIEGYSQNGLALTAPKDFGSACYFSSTTMMLNYLSDADGDLSQSDLYKQGIKEGAVGDGARIQDYNKLAKLAGVEDVEWTKTNSNLVNTMVDQLNQDNPLLIMMPGHSEVVYGYEVKDNDIMFKIKDPGWQGDKYMDASDLKPYHIEDEIKKYSYDRTKKPFKEGRPIFGVGYYKQTPEKK